MRVDQVLRFGLQIADAAARRAAELDPLSLEVRTMVGWVLWNPHRYEEAIKVWAEVLELEPEFGLAIYNQGLAYAMQGRGQEVVSAARRALTVRESIAAAPATWLLGLGYALSGERDQAEDILADLEARYTSNPGSIAVLHYTLGREDAALDWLEKGYQLRFHGLRNVTSEPWFDNLRDHPRFRTLRENMGLPR